jgi:hypothetical protein
MLRRRDSKFATNTESDLSFGMERHRFLTGELRVDKFSARSPDYAHEQRVEKNLENHPATEQGAFA